MNEKNHSYFMSHALRLASGGQCTISPNPMVGCVIVQNGTIVGSGFHQKAGQAHAEIIALNNADEKSQQATMYVTLEPCCHFGKTPPCVHAIIKARIKKVIVACIDPNPLVSGKGIEALRKAGIIVEIGINEKEAIELNKIFFHYIKHKKPFVISKWAMSLDGKTVVHENDDKQISGLKSHYHTHALRHQTDAILIGAHTAIHDDPALTVRFLEQDRKIEKQPVRIILCGHHSMPSQLKIFNTSESKTILVVTEKTKYLFQHHQSRNTEILTLPENSDHTISLPDLLTALGKKEIASVLVEGGMLVHNNFFKENIVNETHIYLSPYFIGDLNHKKPMKIISTGSLDDDFYFKAENNGV